MFNRSGRVSIITAAVLVICIMTVSCSPSTSIQRLNNIINAVEAVFPVVAATAGLPDTTVQQVMSYLASVSTAAGQASTILQNGQSPAMQATEIAKAFAGIIAPQLPPGTPQTVISVVQSVASAVQAFLAWYDPTKLQATGNKPFQLTSKDQAALLDIQKRAAAAVVKAKAVRK